MFLCDSSKVEGPETCITRESLCQEGCNEHTERGNEVSLRRIYSEPLSRKLIGSGEREKNLCSRTR